MTINIEENNLLNRLSKKLQSYDAKNLTKKYYYEGKNSLKDLRIALPPQISHIDTVVGWCNTTINILEERLDLEGFQITGTADGSDLGIQDIFRKNNLDTESSLGHLDSLIFGIGYIVIGTGRTELGEANPLITVESPFRMTGDYSLRERRLTNALLLNRKDAGKVATGTLYLPNETIEVEYDNGVWVEISRDVHNLGRVPVVRLVNQPRSSDTDGKSEITRSIISHTDAAIRTLAGAEVAREYAVNPQRWILGHDEKIFKDSDGNPINAWSLQTGRILGVPYNRQDQQMPQVGAFPQGQLQPYFEQVKAYAQLLASDAAIPVSYLGYDSSNPASADAIRASENRLIKRSERRTKIFGRAWEEAAEIALLVRDGSIPEGINIKSIWRDPSTQTRQAAADEVTKLVQAGILDKDSEIVYRRIGLTDVEKEIVRQENKDKIARQNYANMVELARNQGLSTPTPPASTQP